MSLLDDVRADEELRRPGTKCTTCLLIANSEPEFAAELVEVLSSPVTAKAIANVLRARGYDIASQSLARHRRGDCRGAG